MKPHHYVNKDNQERKFTYEMLNELDMINYSKGISQNDEYGKKTVTRGNEYWDEVFKRSKYNNNKPEHRKHD